MAKLLIAEDDGDIAELYRDAFQEEGFDVTVVGDGEEAIQAARRLKPDLVLLDIGLPGMSGLEVLSEIGAVCGGAPVIVCTAYPLFQMDFRAHRAQGWIEKSGNLKPLKEMARRVMEKQGVEVREPEIESGRQ